MRSPFIIEMPQHARGSQELVWKELSWGSAFKLRRFFKNVLATHARQLAIQDEKNWGDLSRKGKASYRKEAADIMFALRDFPLGIHQILPLAAGIALPNILRLGQSRKDVSKGLLGYHFGILWDNASKEIAGVCTLEKTGASDEVEISYWKHPELGRRAFLAAVTELMSWSKKVAGYKHFKAHIEATTNIQRGNPHSENFAESLGLKQTAVREADDPKGNGKRTLVFTKRDWSP